MVIMASSIARGPLKLNENFARPLILKVHSPTLSFKCVSVVLLFYYIHYSLADVSFHAAIVLEDICSKVFCSSSC